MRKGEPHPWLTRAHAAQGGVNPRTGAANFCYLGTTREPKSAPSSLSRSPTPCRFNHSHLASRVSQGERLMACVHAHPRSMGPKMDSLLYAILDDRFVSP